MLRRTTLLIIACLLATGLLLAGCAASRAESRDIVWEQTTEAGTVARTNRTTAAKAEREGDAPVSGQPDQVSERLSRMPRVPRAARTGSQASDAPAHAEQRTLPMAATASVARVTEGYRNSVTQAANPTAGRTDAPAATAAAYTPRGSAGSESLDQIADSILSRLINNNMSDADIIAAVYGWVRQQIIYSSPASSNYLIGAEAGLRYRRGNCYTRAYTQVALLRRAGIDATYKAEYEGRHCWALVGEYVLDTGFNVFMVKESTLQDYVSAGIYLYRTTASPEPPPSNMESRTVYLDLRTHPFSTEYRLNPDPASLYPDQVISVAGVNGQTRDQWTQRYVDGVRDPSNDLLVEDDQVVAEKVDQIVLVGSLLIERMEIPAAAGGAVVETGDPALDGQRVPGTGENGVLRRETRVIGINPATGIASAFGTATDVVERQPAAYSVYRYTAGSQVTDGLNESVPVGG